MNKASPSFLLNAISRIKSFVQPPIRPSRRRLKPSRFTPETLERRVLLTAGLVEQPQSAVGSAVSSNYGPTILDGLNLNEFIGAKRFYESGYTGTNAVVANIEAGSIWNSHEALLHVAGFSSEQTSPGPQTGDFDRHATWVGLLLGGRPTNPLNEYQTGIAPDATLYSGSIATSWTPTSNYTTAFNYDAATFITPYRELIESGFGAEGQTADVINSSWNNSDYTASSSGMFSRGIDGLVNSSSATVVFSSGNSGAGPNSVGGPAAGYNVITVGALSADTDATPYQTVAELSSRGLNDIFIPAVMAPVNINDPLQGTIVSGVRSVVDIVAPGTNITSALYSGLTGGNSGGTDSTPGKTDGYTGNLVGSSFASPLVAGGAALIVDAARSAFGSQSSASDGRVIKSILQTSADKIPGWSNHQTMNSGIVTTTQSLDPNSGAGRLNLSSAYDLLLSGTANVACESGGPIQTTGWDIGQVSEEVVNDYAIQNVLEVGTSFTATLNWFVDRQIDEFNQTTESSFDNLDLEIWSTVNGIASQKIAQSVSLYNNVEHLQFEIPETGTYLIRVKWVGEIWDLTNDPNAETYALSWSTTGIVDNGVPVASGTAPDIFLAGSGQQIIQVQFSDDTGILSSSITHDAIAVKGPENTVWPVTLQSVTPSGNSQFVTAIFHMDPPGGTWNTSDDGIYQIQVLSDQVFDEAGNAVAADSIGSFSVQIVDRIGPDAFGYVASPQTFVFNDISTDGNRILQNLDDATTELTDVALGDFQFTFYGTTYNSLFISTNGLVTFGTPVSSAHNSDLTSAPVAPAIAVLWDDLSTYGPHASVFWKVQGQGGSRQLIVQWNRIEFLNGPEEITFQLILNMSDNSLIMNYLDLDGGIPARNQGISATTGIRSGNGPINAYLTTSFNGSNPAFVGSHRSVRYYDPRPATPTVLGPNTDHRTFQPQFSWSSSTGAAMYELWVNRITSPATVAIHQTISTLEYRHPADLQIGTYRVWVRVISEQQDKSSWSVPLTIRITAPPAINTPARLQPTARPTLSWQSVPGAANYEIWIDNRSTGQNQFVRYSNLATNSFTPSSDLPFGDYRFWVRAFDQDGLATAWATAMDFAVAYWPTLLGPTGTTLNHQPTFEWSAIDGATMYQIFIRNVLTRQIQTNLLLPSTNSFTPETPLPTGVYDWWVRGLAGNNLAGWWSYSSRISIAGSPILTAPTGNSHPNRPVFEWQSVDQAASYTLSVRRADNSEPFLTFGNLTGTSFQPQTPIQPGTYRAWLQAVASNGEKTWWSVPTQFTVALTPSAAAAQPSDARLWTNPARQLDCVLCHLAVEPELSETTDKQASPHNQTIIMNQPESTPGTDDGSLCRVKEPGRDPSAGRHLREPARHNGPDLSKHDLARFLDSELLDSELLDSELADQPITTGDIQNTAQEKNRFT